MAVYLCQLELNDAELLATEEQRIEDRREQGERRKALAIAEKLLAMNFSPEQIAAITQLLLADLTKNYGVLTKDAFRQAQCEYILKSHP